MGLSRLSCPSLGRTGFAASDLRSGFLFSPSIFGLLHKMYGNFFRGFVVALDLAETAGGPTHAGLLEISHADRVFVPDRTGSLDVPVCGLLLTLNLNP